MRETCPGCGLSLTMVASPAHPYLGASASCWALFGEILAREFGSAALMAVHRLTVDAYAVQHPGSPGRRSTQSVWVHLSGLYCTVERGLAPAFATRVLAGVTARSDGLRWLTPPDVQAGVTIADIIAAPDHPAAVTHWAAATWAAWRPHHAAVQALADEIMSRM